MSIYLKWQDTEPDDRERFISNLFHNLSARWYPVNVIGSNLYDLLEMYGTEFASGSSELTQVFNDLFIDDARSGVVGGRPVSKLYDNFGVMVGVGKMPYQEYGQFNTGSVLNSYRTELKFLTLAYTESTAPDAVSRIGQAINGISPLIIEPINNYPGWVLTSYTGSVVSTVYDSEAKKYYVVVSPSFGRLGNVIPIRGPLVTTTGSAISVSYSVLGFDTVLKTNDFAHAGVLLYFWMASGSAAERAATRDVIETAVSKVLPAYIKREIYYSYDFVTWRPSASGSAVDTRVSGSNVFATSKHGWLYNASPTTPTGSIYVTDVLMLPLPPQ